MDTSPTPPSFNLTYNVAPLDLGADYSKGMVAGQSVGQDIGKGISAVGDVMFRSRTADDTLAALHQNKILSDEAFQSVASKGLGAKEAMVGMYAGAWMAQQKAQIEANIAVQKDVAVQRATHPQQVPFQPQQPGQQAASGAPAPPQAPSTLAPLPGAPQVNVPNLGLTSTQPFAPRTPLGTASDITNPNYNAPTQYKMGPPIGKGQIPPYSKFVTIKSTGKPGVLLSDGVTISPLTGS